MSITRNWDEANPPDTQERRYGAQRMREIKEDVRERFALEHYVGNLTTDPFGMHKYKVVSRTATYTATLFDHVILVSAVGGPVTIHLPSAVGNAGKPYEIVKIDSSANLVTIDPAGTEQVRWMPTVSLANLGDFLSCVSSGTNWVGSWASRTAGVNAIPIAGPTAKLDRSWLSSVEEYFPRNFVSVFGSGLITLPSNVFTKLVYSERELDLEGEYSPIDSRYTARRPGFYLVISSGSFSRTSAAGTIDVVLYRNGISGILNWARMHATTTENSAHITVSSIAYLNGSTDYVEVFASSVGGEGRSHIRSLTVTYVGGETI